MPRGCTLLTFHHMPRPPTRLVNPPAPWTPGLLPDWDVSSVKSALLSHELGNFNASAQMVTAMGRDDRITAVTETRITGLLSLPFQVIPAEVTRAKVRARTIAESVEAFWSIIAPPAEVSAAMNWFILLGVAPVQITWEVFEGVWVPTMKAWDPQFMYWEEGVYKITTREGTQDVTPENGWMLLVQGNRGFMRGAIRSVAVWWLARQWTLRDWCRYSEKHGMPILKSFVPERASDAEKADFFANMSNLGSNTTALLPRGTEGNDSGFDLELLEAKDRAWESFEGLEDRANKNIAVRILGQNLTTEIEGGSFAAAKIHDNIRLDRLQADEHLLSAAIREHMLVPYVFFNFGEEANFAPTPHWDTAPPADLVAKGAAMKALGDGVTSLGGAGLDVSDNTIAELGQEYDLELKRKEVELEPPSTEPNPEDDDNDPQPGEEDE